MKMKRTMIRFQSNKYLILWWKSRRDRLIESALDDLKDAVMFSDEGMQMKRMILSFERLYENERLKCLKQRDITEFFTPV